MKKIYLSDEDKKNHSEEKEATLLAWREDVRKQEEHWLKSAKTLDQKRNIWRNK
jgi:hypothetical protein